MPTRTHSFAPRLHPLVAAAMIWIGLATALPVSLSAAIFRVGSDGSPTCTHDDLQHALLDSLINGAGTDEIRIANNLTYTGEYLIENQSVRIVGGFSSCADNTPSGQTLILREFDERNFRIQGSVNGSRQIELENLDINFLGAVTAVLNEGGAIQLRDGHVLTLKNTNVGRGRSTYGGGIWAAGSTLVLLDGSTVVDNRASFAGGGIYCIGGTVGLSSASLALNDAEDGGGIAVDGGCVLNNYAGGGLEGIFQNTASAHGGGIYAVNGAAVNLIGSPDRSPLVGDNEADLGGGIAVRGGGTLAFIFDSTIVGNEAVTAGGGLWAGESAGLVMDRSTGSPCHGAPRCSQLIGNSVPGSSPQGGGAIAVGSGANASVLRTFVENNSSEFASVGFLGGNAYLYMEGDLMTGNVGNDMVEILGTDPSTFEGLYLTVTGNPTPSSPESALLSDGSTSGSSLTLLSSIVYGTSVLGLSSVDTVATWDCLIVSSTVGLDGDFITVANPLFVNPAAHDYRPAPGSPAIDYCDDSLTSGSGLDLEAKTRGLDDPASPNTPLGTFDLGAFEGPALDNPGIFVDGFESGNTSSWSATVN